MELYILIAAAFITSSISAVLGMGGGIILLGIMAIIIPEGYMVIALHGIIQLISNTTRSYVFRKHIKKNLIKDFLIGAVFGVIASVIIILILIQLFNVSSANDIKVDMLKPLIGIFIIWYLFVLLNSFTTPAPCLLVAIVTATTGFLSIIDSFIPPCSSTI